MRRLARRTALCLVVLLFVPIAGDAARQRRHHTPAPAPVAVRAAPAPPPVLQPINQLSPVPTPRGLAAALAGALRDRALGGRLSLSITDAEAGTPLLGSAPDRLATPASVTKLVTAAAVLAAVGPDARIPTRVVSGASTGEVVLEGGGDPTLSVGAHQAYPGAARLDVLAAAARRAGVAHVTRVVVDGSAYTGPLTGPGWDSDLVASGNVAPITAVMVDGGRVGPASRRRSGAPDLAAGRALAALLGSPRAIVVRGRAPVGASELGQVLSPPLSTLVETTLRDSDNVLAEALARQVARWYGQPASFAGAAAAVRLELARLGLPATADRLVDGSGLSRADLLTARLLVDILVLAASPDHPELRPLLSGLPVAGYSGTLHLRYTKGPVVVGAGDVRAKTGSLSGVSTLAGVLVDADGRLLAFALLADRVPAGGLLPAEAALDRIAAGLARCGCR